MHAQTCIVGGVIPFTLPPESVEIILDLPFPPSTNRIWRTSGKKQVYRSEPYVKWLKRCDTTVLINRQYPHKNKIIGSFDFCLYLSRAGRGDGDNRIKAVLDWLQSREIIADDKDCQKGRWEWVPEAEAPLGCRVHLRSLHG